MLAVPLLYCGHPYQYQCSSISHFNVVNLTLLPSHCCSRSAPALGQPHSPPDLHTPNQAPDSSHDHVGVTKPRTEAELSNVRAAYQPQDRWGEMVHFVGRQHLPCVHIHITKRLSSALSELRISHMTGAARIILYRVRHTCTFRAAHQPHDGRSTNLFFYRVRHTRTFRAAHQPHDGRSKNGFFVLS